ncbi:unnamed protein product [Prorocentrum cordatum]|uniref:SRCR domain-containing protein n=1 Tax=Prorocentrum cordatum TaxID=2364126 RepID=A0ABN9YD07_9DINO|nr:unnamed protein product [Polarella glacialis]
MVADQQIGTMLLVVLATSIPSAASLKTQTFTNTSQAAGSGASCTLADTSGCQDKDVILYNPVTNGDGSVQGLVTFWGGQWGTVCDDVTDCDAPGGGTSPCSNGYVNVAGGQQLAAVVCRELGLDASGAQEYNANGGSSGYPIHVDGTSNHISGCAGTEAALADCAWLLYGSHNCGHHEDVGVICQPAGPTNSPTPSPTPAPTSPPTPPPTPAPTTAPANLALECPAQQGPGQWNDFGASLCVDGSTRDDSSPLIPCTGSVPYTQGGACQSVCHTDYGANPWFEVTLAGAATIDSVKVVNAWTHCCKERIAPFYMRLLDSAGSEISSKRFSSTQDPTSTNGPELACPGSAG